MNTRGPAYRPVETPEWTSNPSLPCKQRTNDFYPDRATNAGTTHYARFICSTCTMQTPCYDLAITNRERFGIWGGVDMANKKERV